MNNSIKYEITGERNRCTILGWHGSRRIGLNPLSHNKGAKHLDIVNLSRNAKKNLVDGARCDEMDSRFSIGMEIEKNSIPRSAIKEYPLFSHWEYDSSCGANGNRNGIEAITNILPLVDAGLWRNKVFSMIHDARKVIEEEYSPSNASCGGHITLGVQGMDGQQIVNAIRKNCGIILALFSNRLKNSYCNGNPTMQTERVKQINMRDRYNVCLIKGDLIEFRIVSRFTSVKQTMRRYELMYQLLDFSINNPNGTHGAFLKRITPIIKSMYSNDMDKVNAKLELAKAFRKVLMTNKINADVVKYFGSRCMGREFYTNDALELMGWNR
jgi:hypothetical protein